MGFDTTSTGSITATSGTVQIALEGNQGAAAVISGTWSMTILADASADGGATWFQVDFFNPLFGVESVIPNTTSNGTYIFTHVGGMSHVRVRGNPYTSGTANVYLRSTFTPIWFTDSVPDNSASPKHVAPGGFHDGANTWYARTPNIFKVTSASAATTADTTVWTPAAGKKFRLMGFSIGGTSGGGAAGSSAYNSWSFWDSTGSSTGAVSTKILIVPGPVNAAVQSPPMGNGIISASTANLLSIVRSSTNVTLDCTVWGTEE